jgi:hypothetical protein
MELGRNHGIAELAAEFGGVALGDARLDDRLRHIVALAAVEPEESFPNQMGSTANREALYRFLSNPKVTMDRVLAGHIRQTHTRMRGHSVIRVVHDTTSFRFVGDRDGVGIIRGGARGFLAHVALAVAPDETREPLGVLGVRPYNHQDAKAHQGMTRGERVTASRAKPREARESSRWERLAVEVALALPKGVRALHIMDQEADDFDLLAEMQNAKLAFVVRGCPSRKTVEPGVCVKDFLAEKPAKLFRTVRVAPRSQRKAVASRGAHPARSERDATLQVRWGRIAIPRRQYNTPDVAELSFWAVHVFEPAPPKGEDPVEWMLFTSEPVRSLAEATDVVDHYRARWLVEEYFKALKTGCSFEKRQLTSYDALVRALGIFVPMAWRLLVLRHLGRAPARRPARILFDKQQMLLLHKLLDMRRYTLPKSPSLRDAMLGIAALGGHIKNNGDPGWMVLGRGFTRFAEAEAVWNLARECDQS